MKPLALSVRAQLALFTNDHELRSGTSSASERSDEESPARSWSGPWPRRRPAPVAAVLALLGSGLLAAATLAYASGRGRPLAPGVEDEVGLAAVVAVPGCHMAVPGETCHHAVVWAMKEGIHDHPQWYPRLTQDSSFVAFQAHLHRIHIANCPLPCGLVAAPSLATVLATAPPTPSSVWTTGAPVATTPTVAAHVTTPAAADLATTPSHTSATMVTTQSAANVTTAAPVTNKAAPVCRTVAEGDPCFAKVEWAKSDGIFAHPEWYPGLSRYSSYEEFQQALHVRGDTKALCPKPCSCHTAVEGEGCHGKVKWAIRDGIFAHPDWYAPLTKYSRFEEFQDHLHKEKETQALCPAPCRAIKWGAPSLFCFAVMVKSSYEPDLMRAQLAKAAGIFACDEFLVIADGKLPLGIGPGGSTTTVEIPHINVGISKDGTAANTAVFMKAWEMVGKDLRYRQHDWVIKADPDSVVIPGRLREQLRQWNGQAVYVKNCGKAQGPGWPMMFGSLEAFSRPAVEAYFAGAQRCANELGWQAWGEDVFMAACLDHLGVGNVVDFSISGDNVCTGGDCGDGYHANYHPHKNVGDWLNCWNRATR